MTNNWKALREARIDARKEAAEEHFQKAFEFVQMGTQAGDMAQYDFEAGQRQLGYAIYQIERVFNLRKAFKLR